MKPRTMVRSPVSSTGKSGRRGGIAWSAESSGCSVIITEQSLAVFETRKRRTRRCCSEADVGSSRGGGVCVCSAGPSASGAMASPRATISSYMCAAPSMSQSSSCCAASSRGKIGSISRMLVSTARSRLALPLKPLTELSAASNACIPPTRPCALGKSSALLAKSCRLFCGVATSASSAARMRAASPEKRSSGEYRLGLPNLPSSHLSCWCIANLETRRLTWCETHGRVERVPHLTLSSMQMQPAPSFKGSRVLSFMMSAV
mmetsp:Transcript_43769/g.93161  ORF Transcript_43769/g.93161 Transcript_43769/m.93161 type:complete len:261 (+) Transcript_43769:429-1211(+)